MSVATAPAGTDTMNDYLHQLKTQDHHVLFSEVVKHARDLANVKAECKQLQLEKAQLVQEDEAWRETLVQVRQKLVGREAEMSAWAQELYDDIGKARADLAIAHRDFAVERQELQSQCSGLQTAVNDSEAAAEAYKASIGAEMLQLKDELAVALEAQRLAQEESNIALKASTEATQRADQANAERDTAQRQRAAAYTQRDQANTARDEASASAAEAAKERDAALKSREAAARALHEESEAKHTAEAATAAAKLELAAAQANFEKSAQQVLSLKRQLQEAQAAAENQISELAAKATDSAMQHRDDVSKAADKLSKLQRQLSDAQSAVAEEKARAEAAEAQKADLGEQLDSLKLSLETARKGEKETSARLSEVKAELTAQQKAFRFAKENAETQVKAAEDSTAVRQQKLDSLTEQLKQAKASLAEHAHKLQSADTAAQEVNRLKIEAESALAKEIEARRDSDAKLTEALKEAAQLKKALAVAEKQEEKLGNHLTAEAAKAKKAAEALELAEGRVNELTASLTDAQLQFECAEKHRALALRQLDAQEEDFGKLGRHLQKAASPAVSTRPTPSMPQASPHQPEVSPRRTSRRDKDLDLPSPVAEDPSLQPAADETTASPVAVSDAQDPTPTLAGPLPGTPAEPQYRGSSDDSDEEMAEEEEADASGTDESDISLQATPKVAVKAPEPKTGFLASVTKPFTAWLSPKPAVKPQQPPADDFGKPTHRPSATSQPARRSRLAVTTAEAPLPSSSPAVATASPPTARHTSPTQAAAALIPAAAPKDLPQTSAQAPAVKGAGQAATRKAASASAAEALQQVKPVRKRGRKGDPSGEPTAAEEAQTRGETKLRRKRARNEGVNEGSPPTGKTLLAEAAAVALPATEQKVPLKTIVPYSQEAQRLFQAYEDAVHRARDPNTTPAAQKQHIAEAGELAEAHIISTAKTVAKTNAAAPVLDAPNAAPITQKRKSARSRKAADAQQPAFGSAQQESASLPISVPAPLAVTYEAAQPSPSGPAKPGRSFRLGKAQDKPEQTAQLDCAPQSDDTIQAPAEAAAAGPAGAAEAADAAAVGGNAKKLDRVESGASVQASKQGAKKVTRRCRTAAAKAADNTPAGTTTAEAAAADNTAAGLEGAESGSDAEAGRAETKKAGTRRGKSGKGKAPVDETPAEGSAIPAGGKAAADNVAAPLHAADCGNDPNNDEASKGPVKAGSGRGRSGVVKAAAQVPLPAEAEEDVPARISKAQPSGKRASSGTTGKSNATGIRAGRVTKAVSNASKGGSRRSSVQAPTSKLAPGRSLRSGRSTASLDPLVGDTAVSKPRHRTRQALDAVPEGESAG